MLKDILRLTRFEHAVMLALAVLIAETIVLGGIPAFTTVIIISLLVPIFSEMGSFALNDYFDIETDRLNKKDRPLVKGTITPQFALYFSITSLVVSTVLAYLINTAAFIIVLAFNTIAVSYSWRLKDTPLLGNVYIALTMAIPFIFGNFVVSETLSQTALILALLGFVAGLAREIIKSVQDMDGDIKARGSKTLPVMIGKGPAIAIAVLLYLLFIPLSAAPFLFGLRFSLPGAVMIGAADTIILYICFAVLRDGFKKARDMSLVAFLLGMLGILISVL